MNGETRQTALGVGGLTIVYVVALMEGFDGTVATTYAIAVIGLISPSVLDRLPFRTKEG